MDYLPFEGNVSLKNPQHIFCLLEDYGTDPNNIPEHPNYIYFGRWVRNRNFAKILVLQLLPHHNRKLQ